MQTWTEDTLRLLIDTVLCVRALESQAKGLSSKTEAAWWQVSKGSTETRSQSQVEEAGHCEQGKDGRCGTGRRMPKGKRRALRQMSIHFHSWASDLPIPGQFLDLPHGLCFACSSEVTSGLRQSLGCSACWSMTWLRIFMACYPDVVLNSSRKEWLIC